MEGSLPVSASESRTSEALARPDEALPRSRSSLETLASRLEEKNGKVLLQLARVFAIPDSGIGLMALAHELSADLVTLSRTKQLPTWATDFFALLKAITETPAAVARDRALLRTQRKCPLRDFLTPWKAESSKSQQEALRTVRANVALRLISARERLTIALATELSRWLQGRSKIINGLEDVAVEQLKARRESLQPDSPQAKLITLVIESYETSLPTPFPASAGVPPIIVPAAPHVVVLPNRDRVELSSPEVGCKDLLHGRKAATANAGCRIFAGIPELWSYLQPFELEAVVPRILNGWRDGRADEAIAALVTLFTGVAPSAFSRIPLAIGDEAGLWVDPECGFVAWNLDQIIASHTKEKPFICSSRNRYVLIPLPLEVAAEVRLRVGINPLGRTMADLFKDAEGLHNRTKAFLRHLSLTSHRPSLKRLAVSWGRYVLNYCADEAYAAAIGIDFTLGTTANFNYLFLRGRRIKEILRICYASIGLSGECATTDIPDVGSLRLPSPGTADRFIQWALSDINKTISALPRNCERTRLFESHNRVATVFYALFKFITGGRSLSEETVVRSRAQVDSGFILLIDKRISEYHERRPCLLPPMAQAWLRAYISWLQLIAYRLAGVAPQLAQAIRSVADESEFRDSHPLFFRLNLKGEPSSPLGSSDIAPFLDKFGLEPNSGRHFLDALLRTESLDSAAIMAWMGRGNPGQEAYSSGSAAVPVSVLGKCASAIECWLGTLGLPPMICLSPRSLRAKDRHESLPLYEPSLLTNPPPSQRTTGGESCPFSQNAVALAGLFVELFRTWRSKAPPQSWAGFALSLIFEDGVFLLSELDAALTSSEHRVLYHHENRVFLDTRCPELGLRRIWLSPISVRLLSRIPASEALLSGTRGVAAAAKELIRDARGPKTNDPLKLLLDCVRSYLSLRSPGLLFSWMNASKFSRTSRPAVIARMLLGHNEHPTFDVRARVKRECASDVLLREISKARKAVEEGRSHRAALRMLADSLAQIDAYQDPDAAEHLVIGYCHYLAVTRKNVFTVERYLSACRSFLAKITSSAENDDFQNIDWRSLIQECLGEGAEGETSSPTGAAINHCLAWLGIDVRLGRRNGPPPSAFTYAERLTDMDVERALSIIASQQKCSGDDWHRAEVALRLMLENALRWDELSSLRLCDVSLSTTTPHLAITYESGANLKTNNAPRVLRITSRAAIEALAQLYAVRVARYPNDGLVPLFGEDQDTRSNTCNDRIHDLILEALRCGSGSAFVTIHNCRHTVITRELHAILDESLCNDARPIQMRQALYRVSVLSGHGHHDVTTSNYVEDFDLTRRNLMNAIQSSMGIVPAHVFLEPLTGIKAATYRKRDSRTSSVMNPDFWEGFHPDQLQHIPNTRQLASLVDPTPIVYQADKEEMGQDRLTASCCYVGLRMLGDDEEKATLAAGLKVQEAVKLERSLSVLQRSRLDPLSNVVNVCRDRFLEALYASRLPIALDALVKSPRIFRDLSGAVKEMSAPWEFREFEYAIELSAFVQALKALGIALQLVLRESGRSAFDADRLSALTNAGLSDVRVLAQRHFPRNVQCMVRFTATSVAQGVKPRASAQLAFLVASSIVALHLLKESSNGNS